MRRDHREHRAEALDEKAGGDAREARNEVGGAQPAADRACRQAPPAREPEGDPRLHDEAAGEGVHREERREARDDELGLRPAQAEEPALRSRGRRCFCARAPHGRARLDGARHCHIKQRHQRADEAVDGEDDAVRVEKRQLRPSVVQPLDKLAREERAARLRDEAERIIRAEQRRHPRGRGGRVGVVGFSARDGFGEARLLDRDERADLRARRRDDANDARDDEHRVRARRAQRGAERSGAGERDAGGQLEQRAENERPPPAEAVGARRQQQRDREVAEQDRAHEHANHLLAQARLHAVGKEDGRDRAVAEHAQAFECEGEQRIIRQPKRECARPPWVQQGVVHVHDARPCRR